MNIKQILSMDLGALLRGGKPPREPRRKWLWRGGKPPHTAPQKPAWRGPVYVPMLLCFFVVVSVPLASLRALMEMWETAGGGYMIIALVALIPPPVFLVLWWSEGFLHFRRRHLVQVLSVLEGMVRCNVPLPEALRRASLDTPNRRVKAVLLALAGDMEMGAALSEAMKPRKRFFPAGMPALLRAAERSGNLAETLAMLIAEEETTEAHSERWRNWLIYYGVLVGISAPFIAVFIISYVFPEFRAIFEDYGVAWPPMLPWVPFPPQVLTGLVLAVLALAFAAYFGFAIYGAAVAYPRHVGSGPAGVLLSVVPYVRNMYFKYNLGTAAALAGTALQGGATLDEALEEASEAPIHPRFQQRLRALGQRINEGQTLSEAMETPGEHLPASFKSLLRVGERSGLLPEAFERIAAIYRGDVRRMTLVLLDVLAPMMIPLIGLMVLSVTFPVLGAITTLADMMSQPF